MASALCLVAPASARADCPGIFSTGTPYFTTCNGVCGTVSASELSCDLDQGGGSDASGTFVSPSATTFRAYGYDDTGAKFCCELGPLDDGCATDEIDVLINGTEDNDDIKLYDTVAGLDLDCSNADIFAGDGIDTIGGSRLTTNWDFLYGEGGVDVIHGNAGVDFIVGGDGADLLFGESESDTILGGDGDDKIKGGDGADTVEAGNHADQVCGEGDGDFLYGEGANDYVYGGDGTDVNDGGTGSSDTCETDGGANCDFYGLTSCPW